MVQGSELNSVQTKERDSWTAFLKAPSRPPKNDDDVIINCIEERAAQFQGFIPVDNLETLQVIKYALLLTSSDMDIDTPIRGFSDRITTGSQILYPR